MKNALFLLSFFFLIGCNGVVKTNSSTKDPKTKAVLQDTVFNDFASALENSLSVKELNIRKGNYTSIPPEIIKFKKIRSLDFSFTQVTSIKYLDHLVDLEYLALSYGELENIDMDWSRLKKLKSLSFLENNVTTIPESICSLSKLETLNISFNEITDIPKCICEMKRLKSFSILYRANQKRISNEEYDYLKSCLPNTKIAFGDVSYH